MRYLIFWYISRYLSLQIWPSSFDGVPKHFKFSVLSIFSNFFCDLLFFLQECPVGTFKNVTGSDSGLCNHCPADELPRRAIYIPVRGNAIMVLWMVHVSAETRFR